MDTNEDLEIEDDNNSTQIIPAFIQNTYYYNEVVNSLTLFNDRFSAAYQQENQSEIRNLVKELQKLFYESGIEDPIYHETHVIRYLVKTYVPILSSTEEGKTFYLFDNL